MDTSEEILNNPLQILSSIIDSSPYIIQVFKAVRDPEGEITDFLWTLNNKRAIEQNGDVIGKSLLKKNPGVIQSGLFQKFLHVTKTGESLDHEQFYNYEQFQGWFRQSLVKLGDGFIMTTEDITSKKQIEIKLQEQLRFSTKLGAILPDIITISELRSCKIIYSNSERLVNNGFGIDQIDNIGLKQKGKSIHPDDKAKVEKYHKRFYSLKDTEENAVEYRVVHEKGTFIWLSLRGKVFRRDQHGVPTHLLTIARDITAQKEAEEALLKLKLEQQRELLNAILEAQESERKRLGEDLHDGLAQLLYATQIKQGLIPTTDKAVYEAVREASHLLTESINQTRNLSFQLVPTVLRSHGLGIALQAVIDRLGSPKLKILLITSGDDLRLSDKIEFAFYRMGQELLSNVIKHSGATEAEMKLEVSHSNILLKITDNGVGFDAKKLNPTHIGIGMQSVFNRAKLLNASVNIDSMPGKGTSAVINLKIHRKLRATTKTNFRKKSTP